MKKLLLVMIVLTLSFSLVACGGADTPDPSTSKSHDLVVTTGNGLSFALPSDIKYVKTDDSNGAMLFANDEKTAVVTVGVKTEDTTTIADITEDVLLQSLSVGGSLSNAKLDNSGTVEQASGTAIVGFGTGTLSNGTDMNSVIQYFFPGDGGGYYAISYLYVVDGGSSLDTSIENVLATVKTAE